MKHMPLILFGVLLNAIAQLCLKLGMEKIGKFGLNLPELTTVFPKVLTAPYIWAGMTCYSVSVLVWLVVLSRVEVGFAYPMVSLGYILTLIFGWWLLNENVTPLRLVGVALIILGVYLISRTGQQAA